MTRVGRWLACALVAWAGSARAQEDGVVNGRLGFQLPVTDATFATGFRFAIAPDDTVPVIGVEVVVDAGATEDPIGSEGLAHLIEHVGFRAPLGDGTPIGDALDAAGCEHNAFTDWDDVRFVAACPPDAVNLLLAVAAHWAVDPTAGVDAGAFALERDIVGMERELDEQEGGADTYQPLLARLDPAGPYARSVIGTAATVSPLTLDTAQAFVKAHYVPAHETVVITGAMTVQTAETGLFRKLPASWFAADATALEIRRWAVPGGDPMSWPADPAHRDQMLMAVARRVPERIAWTPPATSDRATPETVAIPGLDARHPVPAVMWVLPPIDPIADGFDGDELGAKLDDVLRPEMPEDRYARCSVDPLVHATLVVCQAPTRTASLLGVSSDPVKVAALMSTKLRTWAERAQVNEVKAAPTGDLARELGFCDELAEPAAIGGGRLDLLATMMHAGEPGDALAQLFGSRALIDPDAAAERFAGLHAGGARLAIVLAPLPHPAVVATPLADSRPASSDVAAALAAHPLIRSEDVAIDRLQSGLTVVALRWGRSPVVHIGWYGHGDHDAPPLVRTLVDDAMTESFLGPDYWDDFVAESARDSSARELWDASGVAWVDETVMADQVESALHRLALRMPGIAGELKLARLHDERRLYDPSRPDPKVDPTERREYGWLLEQAAEQQKLVREEARLFGGSISGPDGLDVPTWTALHDLDDADATRALANAFQPSQSIVVISGAIDPRRAVYDARVALSGVAVHGAGPTTLHLPDRPAGHAGILLVQDDQAAPRMLDVAMSCRAPERAPDAPIVAGVLGQWAYRDMFAAFRDRRGMAYDPGGYAYLDGDAIRVDFGVTVRADLLDDAVHAIDDVRAHFTADVADANALATAQLAWGRNSLMRAQDASGIGGWTARRVLAGIEPTALFTNPGGAPIAAADVQPIASACATAPVLVVRGQVKSRVDDVRALHPDWELEVIDEHARFSSH